MSHASLHIKSLACERSDSLLFEGVDRRVACGECLQVIGPNGCGKTSLLKILVGLLSSYQGDVWWCGSPINKVRPDYYANMIYLGHKLGLKSDLTLYENLSQAIMPLHHSRDIIQHALQCVGLIQFQDQFCAELSRGQCQRTALARLWLTDALVWILDEPFSGLDAEFIVLLQHKMSSHLDRGGLIVLTTHQPLTLTKLSIQTLDLALFKSQQVA